jgi:hypothetical protein
MDCWTCQGVRAFFDTIPHQQLVAQVARRILDEKKEFQGVKVQFRPFLFGSKFTPHTIPHKVPGVIFDGHPGSGLI